MSARTTATPSATPRTMTVATSRVALDAARARLAGRVAVVMTMGALHEGHAELIRAARALADGVVVTIFVNPLQFGPQEDMGTYPRTLEPDLAVCEQERVDIVYVPSVSDVYPKAPAVSVVAGALGDVLEGADRPGHFTGVLTVVAKLLHQVRPQLAVFGEKDYQQLVLIRAMVADLDFDVDVLGVVTVRQSDGLALSSRNAYLSQDQRRVSGALPSALRAGRAAGPEGPAAVVSATMAVLDREPDLQVDYVALRSPDLATDPTAGHARLLAAVRVGTTRLIDNTPVDLGPPDRTREY